jgi:crossover junction endodeoxyribonuclease RuvC
MIILGIDTALRCTGYGVIEMRSLNDMSVKDCGVIKNAQSLRHSECLRRIAGGVREILSAVKPDAASIEDAYYMKNVKTSMILSLARGAAITVLAEAGVPVYSYSPRSIKKAVTGSGGASKDQIARLLSVMLKISVSDIPLDSTDALAAALCHGQVAMRPELRMLLPPQL